MPTHNRTIVYKTIAIVSLLCLIWSIIVSKLFLIQVIDSKQYQARCKRQTNYKKPIQANRGLIYDRNGNSLTMDIVKYSFAAHPYLISDKDKMAASLHNDFKKPLSFYKNKLNSDNTFEWLAKDIPESEILSGVNKYKKHSGIAVFKNIRRNYPFTKSCGQLIGFTNIDNVGISGLELEYDSILSGEPGWTMIQKDGLGQFHRRPDMPYKEEIQGNNITLNIDTDFQEILYEELKNSFEKHNADKALGIVINPQNGEILAMASAPAFDPNNPGKYPISDQKNRPITDTFEPGSTFKIVTATAALEENMIQPEDSIDCSKGYIRVGGRNIHDHKKYGKLSFTEVIKNSSNVGTIKVAQKIRKGFVFQYARKFGFGVKSDISFPGETSGILHPLNKWTDLTLSQVSIGHGVSCSVLQLAYAYAAIANGGYLLKPQLVKSISTYDNIVISNSGREVIRRIASQKTMNKMRELLRLTVQSGTGRKAKINGMSIAGKTGTAQKIIDGKYSKTDYIATFAGFFPAKNPRLLCVVMVDNPKNKVHTGGSVAAPVVSNIFKRIYNSSNYIIFQDEEDKLTKNEVKSEDWDDEEKLKKLSLSSVGYASSRPKVFSSNDKIIMPDLKNLSLSKAYGILSRLGFKEIITEGEGIVVSQYPAKKIKTDNETKCILKCKARGNLFD